MDRKKLERAPWKADGTAFPGPEQQGDARQTRRVRPLAEGPLVGLRIQQVPMEMIDHSDEQFRFRYGLLPETLLKSIKAHGQQQPIMLRKRDGKKLQVISGFRRMEALRQLKKSTVLAIIRRDISDVEGLKISVLENEARKTYTDMDRAMVIVECKRNGQTNKEIAALFGIGIRQVQRLSTLSDFPPYIQVSIDMGKMKTTAAIRIMVAVKKLPEAHWMEWWTWYLRYNPSYRELDRAVDAALEKLGKVKPIKLFGQKKLKDGRTSYRLRPISIDDRISDGQKKQILKELRALTRFVEKL